MHRVEFAGYVAAVDRLVHQGDYDLVLGEGQYASVASRVAGRIEDYLYASGWPVGAVIGSETALQEHFQVNRPVLRQAIVILTERGVVRMKVGRGGGLVVSSPDASSVAQAIALYMRWNGVTDAHALAARQMITAWRPLIEPQALSLEWLSAFDALEPEMDMVGLTTHGRGSATIAARRMLDEMAHGEQGGGRLGSIFGLAERMRVTPRVAIAAVRLLEEAGLVETRRGRCGGLVSGHPKQYPMARLAHGLMLARRVPKKQSHAFVWRLNAAHAAIAARRRCEMAVLDAQMDRIRAACPSRLRTEWTRLQRELGNAAGNPALDMLARCFASFNLRLDQQTWQIPSAATRHRLLQETENVVRAIRNGDAAIASEAQMRCQDIIDSMVHGGVDRQAVN